MTGHNKQTKAMSGNFLKKSALGKIDKNLKKSCFHNIVLLNKGNN